MISRKEQMAKFQKEQARRKKIGDTQRGTKKKRKAKSKGKPRVRKTKTIPMKKSRTNTSTKQDQVINIVAQERRKKRKPKSRAEKQAEYVRQIGVADQGQALRNQQRITSEQVGYSTQSRDAVALRGRQGFYNRGGGVGGYNSVGGGFQVGGQDSGLRTGDQQQAVRFQGDPTGTSKIQATTPANTTPAERMVRAGDQLNFDLSRQRIGGRANVFDSVVVAQSGVIRGRGAMNRLTQTIIPGKDKKDLLKSRVKIGGRQARQIIDDSESTSSGWETESVASSGFSNMPPSSDPVPKPRVANLRKAPVRSRVGETELSSSSTFKETETELPSSSTFEKGNSILSTRRPPPASSLKIPDFARRPFETDSELSDFASSRGFDTDSELSSFAPSSNDTFSSSSSEERGGRLLARALDMKKRREQPFPRAGMRPSGVVGDLLENDPRLQLLKRREPQAIRYAKPRTQASSLGSMTSGSSRDSGFNTISTIPESMTIDAGVSISDLGESISSSMRSSSSGMPTTQDRARLNNLQSRSRERASRPRNVPSPAYSDSPPGTHIMPDGSIMNDSEMSYSDDFDSSSSSSFVSVQPESRSSIGSFSSIDPGEAVVPVGDLPSAPTGDIRRVIPVSPDFDSDEEIGGLTGLLPDVPDYDLGDDIYSVPAVAPPGGLGEVVEYDPGSSPSLQSISTPSSGGSFEDITFIPIQDVSSSSLSGISSDRESAFTPTIESPRSRRYSSGSGSSGFFSPNQTTFATPSPVITESAETPARTPSRGTSELGGLEDRSPLPTQPIPIDDRTPAPGQEPKEAVGFLLRRDRFAPPVRGRRGSAYTEASTGDKNRIPIGSAQFQHDPESPFQRVSFPQEVNQAPLRGIEPRENISQRRYGGSQGREIPDGLVQQRVEMSELQEAGRDMKTDIRKIIPTFKMNIFNKNTSIDGITRIDEYVSGIIDRQADRLTSQQVGELLQLVESIQQNNFRVRDLQNKLRDRKKK